MDLLNHTVLITNPYTACHSLIHGFKAWSNSSVWYHSCGSFGWALRTDIGKQIATEGAPLGVLVQRPFQRKRVLFCQYFVSWFDLPITLPRLHPEKVCWFPIAKGSCWIPSMGRMSAAGSFWECKSPVTTTRSNHFGCSVRIAGVVSSLRSKQLCSVYQEGLLPPSLHHSLPGQLNAHADHMAGATRVPR